MTVEFTVRGKKVAERSGRDEFADLYGDDVGYEVRGEVRVAGVNRGDAAPVVLDGEDDDVVEVEDVDGVVTFHRAAGLVDRAGGARGVTGVDLTDHFDAGTRGDGTRLAAVRRVAVTLPPDVQEAVGVVDSAVGAEMDRSGLLGEGLSLLARPLFDEAAKAAMRKIVDWIDEPVSAGAEVSDEVWRRKAKPRGVYQVGEDLRLSRTGPLRSAPAAGDDPFLVLLHGTFSHTEGAFTALRGTTEWKGLAARYQGRMLAVEHATLGLTPAQNALQAAAFLPEGARLHLVSHSRGGLVGEALSYAGKHEPVLDTFPEGHPDLDALPRLHDLLVDRGITVERFVRVACPARGTTLASHRVDKWASFLFNVFNFVPVLRESGIAALVKKFLVTLLEQRTDPRLVPGLEAQMPESPFLRMLLTAQSLDDGLGSIAGDVQGAGFVRRLAVLGADLFYREDHDYVVPTSSMSGGATRVTPRTRSFQGSEVNHGSYFANVDSRRALKAWLEAKSGEPVEGFEAKAPPPPPGRRRGVSAPDQAEVLLVPDVFGCTLNQGGLTTWPDVSRFVTLRAEKVLTGPTRPEDLVPAYAPLETALGARHRVMPFPYNPRVTFEQSAARLAKLLRARLDSGAAPHLVAHGTGAFVVLGALKGLHAEWRAAGGRAVLLGPPLDGSRLVEARLAGRDEFTAAIALLDGRTTPEAVGEWLAGWPTLRALLPGERAVRAALMPADWSGISAVRGTADRTVSGRNDRGEFTVSSNGDGFASHGGRRVSGPVTWYALTPHADLPEDPEVARVVLDLLAGRTPARMLTSPPVGSPREDLLPDPRGRLVLPTDGELVRMAWGGGRTTALQVLRVSVVHGHLNSVQGPVLVGHQDGTSIGGAERAADDHLDHVLERRLNMRQYPGPLGTCEVFTTADGPAAVVIGVGDAGDLTPGALTVGVIQAVLRLAAVHEDRSPRDGRPDPLTISAVLIGTSLVPPMPVENSATAIVTGVRQANRRLRDLRSEVFVEELKIVELYEERAIQATRALSQSAGSLDGEVVVERLMLEGVDGKRGLPRPDYHADMWRTVRIVAADPDNRVRVKDDLVELSFTSIGRHARAEQRVNTSQRRLLDELVAEAVADVNPDAQLFNTLYELLVPNALKGQGYGSEHLMVVVDDQAGVLPLEMLATRTEDDGVLPLAVQVGVVRRLETRTYAEVTRPSSGNAALVIGDPAGTGLPRLPGARAEAHHVVTLLRSQGYDVTAIIPDDDADEDVVDILNALFRHDYRIVHVAGHGHYDPDDPTRSGVRIGVDAYLGALEIAKMRTAPDLVFVNSCHLGAMWRSAGEGPVRADRLASSVSRQLVENGVRAVIAAGWAVNDEAAKAFADRLYGGLLAGRELGVATLEARKHVHSAFKATNTWGAYQVYGPPAFRLDPTSTHSPAVEPPVARREFADRLADLQHRATRCRDDEVDALADELLELLAAVPVDWCRGQEQSTTGDVWMLLARYAEAVACFESVRSDWEVGGSVLSLEQLANVQAKWAVERDRHPDEPGPAAADLLAAAEKSVALLIDLGETPGRYSLQGGVARRRAQCVPLDRHDDLTAALATARDSYAHAVELHRGRTGDVDFYPALNQVVLGWLVAKRSGEHPQDEQRARALIADSRKAAKAAKRANFWALATEADADLAEALLDGTLPSRVEAIAKSYTTAFTRSSRRDRAAVGEHIDVLVRALPASCDDVVVALRDLRTRLAVPEG